MLVILGVDYIDTRHTRPKSGSKRLHGANSIVVSNQLPFLKHHASHGTPFRYQKKLYDWQNGCSLQDACRRTEHSG
jgi:hypothetical protein